MADDKGYPLPDGPISGYPLICVTLKIPDAPQYRQDFIGHIWELGKWWNWEHSGVPGDTRATQAAQYWRDLIYDHMVIGDCPVDCCDDILAAIAALQLQADTQGKLQVTRDVTQQQITSQQLRDKYAEEYDGSPTSINPNAPTTDFGSTGDRFDALCAALMAFVYQFARGQVQAVVAGDVGAFALLAGAAILLIPGLNIFYAIGASIALLVGGGLVGVTTAAAIEALTDTAALNNVVCFLRDTLKSQAVTEAHWSSVLDSYPFSVGSHEAIICDFIKPTLASNYFTILDMLGQAYEGTINGEPLPECPCTPEPIEVCYNFVPSKDGWESIVTPGGFAWYYAGQGWGPESGQFAIEKTITDTITSVTVTFSEPVPQCAVHNTWGNGYSRIAVINDIRDTFTFIGLSMTAGLAIGIDPTLMPGTARCTSVCYSTDV